MKQNTSKAIAQIEKILKDAPPNKTMVVQFSMDHIWECNSTLLKILEDQGYSGIYATLIKSYNEISKDFEEKQIDSSKIIFIDGISKLYGYSESKNKNVHYIKGPVALDDLFIKIKKGFESITIKKKYIFIGSLTSIMLYNSKEKIIEFLSKINDIINNEHALVLASQYCDSDLAKTVENTFENETISIDLRDCT